MMLCVDLMFWCRSFNKFEKHCIEQLFVCLAR